MVYLVGILERVKETRLITLANLKKSQIMFIKMNSVLSVDKWVTLKTATDGDFVVEELNN